MPGHVLHEAKYYVITLSAARCNAQYSYKTTRLNTFGSHLVCFYSHVTCGEDGGTCNITFILSFSKILISLFDFLKFLDLCDSVAYQLCCKMLYVIHII